MRWGYEYDNSSATFTLPSRVEDAVQFSFTPPDIKAHDTTDTGYAYTGITPGKKQILNNISIKILFDNFIIYPLMYNI